MTEKSPLPKTKLIEVRVTHAELIAAKSSPLAETLVVGKLRDSGIPVLGTLLYTGIAVGELHIERDWDNDCIIYRWIA